MYYAQATNAIAVWAVTDKFPVTGTAHIGVSAYHESGVSVTFKIDGIMVGTATQEEINPTTGYPEYFVTINTKDYTDGDHTLDATATPVSGTALNLAQITLKIENTFKGKHYYVDGTNGDDTKDGLSVATAWKTIDKANTSTGDHDSITVIAGDYTSNNRFERTGSKAFRHWVGEKGKTVKITYGTHYYLGAFESLDGFTITGNGRSLCWYPYAPNNHGDHVVIKNAKVLSTGLYGIAAYDMQDCAFINVDLTPSTDIYGTVTPSTVPFKTVWWKTGKERTLGKPLTSRPGTLIFSSGSGIPATTLLSAALKFGIAAVCNSICLMPKPMT
jgi:hypothetical protein